MALLGAVIVPSVAGPSSTMPGPDKNALAAVERMADFFATQVAVSGGFVYAYSSDLAVRRGEGRVEEGVIWNQPPGTPAVGGAFLRLYEFTRDPRWIAAAGAAAQNMIDGQLLSGGWYNFTETVAAIPAQDGAIGPRSKMPTNAQGLKATRSATTERLTTTSHRAASAS